MESNLIRWCEEEVAMMQNIMKLMQDGVMKASAYEKTSGGTKRVDKTDEWIQEYKRRIGELLAIIDQCHPKGETKCVNLSS